MTAGPYIALAVVAAYVVLGTIVAVRMGRTEDDEHFGCLGVLFMPVLIAVTIAIGAGQLLGMVMVGVATLVVRRLPLSWLQQLRSWLDTVAARRQPPTTNGFSGGSNEPRKPAQR